MQQSALIRYTVHYWTRGTRFTSAARLIFDVPTILPCCSASEVDRARSRQTELVRSGFTSIERCTEMVIFQWMRLQESRSFVHPGRAFLVKEERREHLRFFLHGIFFYLAFSTRVRVASGISDLVKTNNNEKRKLLVEEIQLTDKVGHRFTPISNVLRDFKFLFCFEESSK